MAERGRRLGRSGRILVLVGVALVVLLVTGRTLAGYYVESLWSSSLGYGAVFWKRVLWLWGLRLAVASATAALVFVNLRIVASTLGSIQIKRRYGNIEIAEQLPEGYALVFAVVVSLVAGLWFAAALPGDSGLQILISLEAPRAGILDPVLNRDLSYYLFRLPLQRAVLTVALLLVFVVALLSVVGYAVTGAARWARGRLELSDVPRLHLSGLVVMALLLLAWRYRLARYALVTDGNGFQGIFGYADAQGRIPAYNAIAVLGLVAAAGIVWSALSRRPFPALAGIAAFLAGALGLGGLYPAFVQRLRVEPNELERETPYLEWNLAFTRQGFALDALRRARLDPRPPSPADWEQTAAQFEGLPMWTREALLTTFRQVEAHYRYYNFFDVAIDRYAASQGYEPVGVSAREIDPTGIEEPNWQNLHLRERFIVGMGGVASAVAKSTVEGRPHMYLSSIPPVPTRGAKTPAGLALERPSIFFGSQVQPYAIINPGSSSAPGAAGVIAGRPGVDFPPGIVLRSPLRILALAWRFQDANLLFASEISESSRFIFRRQVEERARALAPFLAFLEPPQPVIHEGHIVWLLDGFTVSRRYPLSTAYELPTGAAANYVRNSVKATVDAVTGAVTFFAADTADVLLTAYRAAFPELFRDLDEMPAPLRAHLRYPTALFELQATVLAQYHQETAASFHGQHDLWATTHELADKQAAVPYRSEYAFLRLPGEDRPEFVLGTVFVPAGRQNLTALFLARCDAPRYGELILVELPRDRQIPGPRQVEALVEQDPGISEQFSLWRQSGSEVWSGHLRVVPVGNALLYVEPIFLAAEEGAIPELRRSIVSDGERVVMAPTLAEAIERLRSVAMAPEGGGGTTTSGGSGQAAEGSEWPTRALELLEEAEARARQGDWQGFGEALVRLRGLLQRFAAPAPR
ncbi:MAG: UPF0182 family protein [Gemmatimonadetes bacterium]|nr:UPF0182 family protein [Gemmatimonadota bacterium]